MEGPSYPSFWRNSMDFKYTKQDFKYTKQDLNSLKAAFSDYIDSPSITEPQFFLVGQGVLRFLENWMSKWVE